jgi:hypothetical protein
MMITYVLIIVAILMFITLVQTTQVVVDHVTVGPKITPWEK